MGAPKDLRTPQAKKWADDFIPPETCGSIDDVQNALENLRDANSQLRHAAHLWKHVAMDELGRRRVLGDLLLVARERLAEISRISGLRAEWDSLLAIRAAADEGLSVTASPADIPRAPEGEEFLEFKEALSDLRSLRHEYECLNGGGPGWAARNKAAWAKVDELFANEDEAADQRRIEDFYG